MSQRAWRKVSQRYRTLIALGNAFSWTPQRLRRFAAFFVEVFVRPAGRTNTSTPEKEEFQRDEQGFPNGIELLKKFDMTHNLFGQGSMLLRYDYVWQQKATHAIWLHYDRLIVCLQDVCEKRLIKRW